MPSLTSSGLTLPASPCRTLILRLWRFTKILHHFKSAVNVSSFDFTAAEVVGASRGVALAERPKARMTSSETDFSKPRFFEEVQDDDIHLRSRFVRSGAQTAIINPIVRNKLP